MPGAPWEIAPDVLETITVGWPPLGPKPTRFLGSITRAMHSSFRVEEIPLPRSDLAVALFEVRLGEKVIPVVLDFRDNSDLREDFLARCAVYFKMQCRSGGYGHENVFPGGYVTDNQIMPAVPFLRATRDRQREEFDVYGRFGMHSAQEIRQKAVEMLSAQTDFEFEGGTEIVRFSQYLMEMSTARICLDLPGRGDFCYRLVDYLAVGSCIVSVRHGNKLPVDLRDGHDIAYVEPDLSNLLEVVRYYLANPEARDRLIRNSRQYFDNYLHPLQLVRYYVATAIEYGSDSANTSREGWAASESVVA